MSETTLIMTVEQMQKDRDEWLKLRKTGLGGSDAGVVAGVSQWKSIFTLWLEKTGQAEPEDISNKEAVMWGNRLEEDVAQYFSETTGKKIRRSGMLRNNKYPFLLADPDRLVIGESAGVEIKTTAYWNKEEWKDDEIPASYYCQCLHYMLVTGLERWYICCLLGGQHYICKCIERKDVEEELKILLDAEIDFWNNYVLTNKLPAVDGSDSCTKAIKQKFPGGDDNACELSDEIDQLLLDRDKYKAQISQMEKVVSEIENKIRIEMENQEFGRSSSFNVYYKPKQKQGFDAKQFAKDYPALYEKYKKNTVYRALVIKISKARTKEM